jgi:membrane protein required for colicin V production
MKLEIIDVIFITVIVIFLIRCALRGFIKEVMTMASLVLGLGAAFFFHKSAGAFIRERYMQGVDVIPEVLGFLGLFLIVFLVIRILEYLLKDIADRINLGGIDRFLGMFFGILEGLIAVSLVLFVLENQPLFDARHLLENSVFARFLLPYFGVVRGKINGV